MKKLVLFLMALMTITNLSAKSVWSESFNYAVGDLTTKTTQDNLISTDYTSWYYTQSGSNTLLQVADTNLTYPNYCTKATGKAVKITARGYKTSRQFASITSGSVYAGALITINSLQGSENTKECILYMTDYIAGNKMFAKLHTLKLADGYKLGIAKGAESSSYLRYSDKLSYGQTYLIAVKYDIVDGEKNDFVSLFINPTAETTVPTLTCVRDTATSSGNPQGADAKDDPSDLSGFGIYQSANTSRDMVIDEIKVATAWADLWEGGSDVKTPTLVVPEDKKSYNFGELTIGKDVQTYSFTVKGTDLTEAVTVTKTHADVAVSPASIAVADAAKTATVTVTVTPTATGDQKDTIVLSSSKLTQKVAIAWKAVEAPIIDPTAELLSNPSFEQYSSNPIFGVSWTDWTLGMGQSAIESTDVLDGEVALKTNITTTNIVLSQQVTLGEEYPAGTQFELKINYKFISGSEGDVTSSGYWHSARVDSMDADGDILVTALEPNTSWTEKTVIVTKPEGANSLYVRYRLKKGVIVLFDKFSLKVHESTDPMFTVTPESVKAVESNINQQVLMGAFVVKQANLTNPVLVEISGTGKDKFTADKSSLTKAVDTVKVYFKSSKVGHFTAVVNFMDDPEATLYNTSRTLTATAIDPTKTPTITVTPTSLPAFSCKAKETQPQSVSVTSENCIDDVHVTITQTKGSGFTIDQSQIVKNTPHTTVITFCPMTEGEYAATITWTTEKGNTITMDVTGTATKADPIPVDYDTTFVWNTNNPYTYLKENFASALPDQRNKTLRITDWQNVVRQGTRAWWGYNSDTTTQAKATGYMFGVETPTDAEMWLVTPALDYKNATKQVFSFKVMSDMLFEGQNHELQVYYIDPSDPQDIFSQHLEEVDELIPYGDDQLENTWYPIVIDLTGQPYIPDVFFMAFKFTDKACNNGGEYFVTDVVWGEQSATALPTQQVKSDARKYLHKGQLVIEVKGVKYNMLGAQQ